MPDLRPGSQQAKGSHVRSRPKNRHEGMRASGLYIPKNVGDADGYAPQQGLRGRPENPT